MTIPRHGLAALGRALACALFLSNYVCSSQAEIKPDAFHRTIDGSQVDLYALKNSNGLEAKITNYGGIVVSLTAPDKNGKFGDVVLGYDTLNDYIGSTPYFGCLVGRYGNRIAKGRFTTRTLCMAVAGDSIRRFGRPRKSRPATDQASS